MIEQAPATVAIALTVAIAAALLARPVLRRLPEPANGDDKPLYRELATELDAVLLSTCFDDGVHDSPGARLMGRLTNEGVLSANGKDTANVPMSERAGRRKTRSRGTAMKVRGTARPIVTYPHTRVLATIHSYP